jgi:hypothetical protein
VDKRVLERGEFGYSPGKFGGESELEIFSLNSVVFYVELYAVQQEMVFKFLMELSVVYVDFFTHRASLSPGSN